MQGDVGVGRSGSLGGAFRAAFAIDATPVCALVTAPNKEATQRPRQLRSPSKIVHLPCTARARCTTTTEQEGRVLSGVCLHKSQPWLLSPMPPVEQPAERAYLSNDERPPARANQRRAFPVPAQGSKQACLSARAAWRHHDIVSEMGRRHVGGEHDEASATPAHLAQCRLPWTTGRLDAGEVRPMSDAAGDKPGSGSTS